VQPAKMDFIKTKTTGVKNVSQIVNNVLENYNVRPAKKDTTYPNIGGKEKKLKIFLKIEIKIFLKLTPMNVDNVLLIVTVQKPQLINVLDVILLMDTSLIVKPLPVPLVVQHIVLNVLKLKELVNFVVLVIF
jgi:hypothetical protein